MKFPNEMIELQRITTGYDEIEDRICLSGEDESGRTLAIWLPRRLLDRLVPHLVLWLEGRQVDYRHAEFGLSCALHEARARLTPQPPVRPDTCPQNWLARSIDLQPDSEHVALVFRGPGEASARIGFAPEHLMQWLDILRQMYAQAEWPQTPWPAWMIDRHEEQARSVTVWH